MSSGGDPRPRFGFVPRGRAELRRLLSAVDVDALVPDPAWRREDDRTWRTGIVGGEQAAWQAAARSAGSVTAWRAYSAGGRWLWLQVVPLAARADAPAALAAAADPAHAVRNPRAQVAVVERTEVDPPPDVTGADDVTATAETTSPRGDVFTLRATAGPYLVIANASGPGWQWSELAAVVAAQLARLR